MSIVAERLGAGTRAEEALSNSILVAVTGGIVVSMGLLVWGPNLLKATGCDVSLLPASWEYLRIRAWAAPAAIVTQVAQAGLLGQRDSRTPFKIVLLSIAISLLGDMWLVGGMGLGVAGAAATTLIAQYVSAVLLLRALCQSRVRPYIKLPSWEDLQALLSRASALGIYYVAKTTSYLFLQATAARLPALLLAAHQPVWQLWGLCSFMNTPLEQAALAFIPASSAPKEHHDLVVLLLAMGAVSGVVCATVAHGLTALVPHLLTADPSLWPHMQSVWIPGSIALMACGIDVSSTGVLLACKDVGYVARSMIISMAALITFLSASAMHGLLGVWWGLAIFFGARVVQSLPRALTYHLRPQTAVVEERMLLVQLKEA